MVIKGGSRSGGGDLAAHLLRTDTNERAEVMELQGVVADRLPEALREMEAVATGTRCRKSLYHASINTGPGEELTLEQKAMAVARLELALGLEGHARAVVEHRKEGRDHLHVVWSRIDVDTMRATHDGHNYRKHEAVARDLEREFGHNRVQGAHIERETPEGKRRPRPPRTPSPDQVQQATRTKRDLPGVAADLTRLWRTADTGQAFAVALEGAGYVLAQGDRRGFVVIDQAGGVHSLARRIEGAKTKDVNARLAGVELAGLPTADQARAMQRDRSLPAKERPAGRFADELTRPADARAERACQEERQDAARAQIRTDLDKHLREQAEKRSQALEMAPRVVERAPGPEAPARPAERAQPSPDRRDGPNFQQQLADSAEHRRERAETARAPRPAAQPSLKSEAAKDAGRAIGKASGLLSTGLGRAAGGAFGILGKLLGAASKAVDAAAKPVREDEKERKRPIPPNWDEPRPRPSPVKLPKPTVPPRPSVFDEIQAKIRERDAQGGKTAPTPQPEKDKDRDRSRFEIRPSIRLQAIVSGDYMGWVTEAKRRLIAYSERTGESVLAQLSELEAIVFRAVYGDQRGPG